MKLIEKPDFLEHWQNLYLEVANGFSVFQSCEFIKTWYGLYKEYLEPVLCIAHQDKKLVGLMFIAWHKTKKTLVHAGENEAEYHGWLGISGVDLEFLRQSFIVLKKTFEVSKWDWKWMPPKTRPDGIRYSLPNNMSIVLETQEAPIWNLKNPDKLKKLRKSKSLKSKMRRLQKKGTVTFEVLESTKRLKEVLKQVKIQYDFRQEGVYGATAFKKDPLKEGLTLALFNAGIAHASVLWLDDRVLAFHFGCKDDIRVCLGIISYDPSESKNSPGTLIMVELADYLSQKGYHYFDLTPGTNSYKDRFANEYQTLYKPTVYFDKLPISTFKKLKIFGTNLMIRATQKIGIELATLRDIRNYFKELPKDISIKRENLSSWQIVKRFFYKKLQLLIYTVNKTYEADNQDSSLHYQKYEHLLCYNNHWPFTQKRRLLKNALQKFSRGAELYSAFENEELIWYGWCVRTKMPLSLGGYPVAIEQKQGITLGDFYENSRFSKPEKFSENVERMLESIPLVKKEKPYIILKDDQQLLPEIIEKWDIEHKETKTCVRLCYFLSWPLMVLNMGMIYEF